MNICIGGIVVLILEVPYFIMLWQLVANDNKHVLKILVRFFGKILQKKKKRILCFFRNLLSLIVVFFFNFVKRIFPGHLPISVAFCSSLIETDVQKTRWNSAHSWIYQILIKSEVWIEKMGYEKGKVLMLKRKIHYTFCPLFCFDFFRPRFFFLFVLQRIVTCSLGRPHFWKKKVI